MNTFGTSFSWNGNVVAKLKVINGVEVSALTQEITNHQSSNGYKEHDYTGLLEVGDLNIEGAFDEEDATGQHAMFADMIAKTKRQAVITFPNSIATWTLPTALVTNVKIGDAAVEGEIPFTATIKVSGAPTLAIATSTGLTTPFFTVSGEGTVIAPTASGSVYSYIVNVANGVSEVAITPTASAGVITVDGNTVTSGEASTNIALTAGVIKEVLIVVTETNKAPKTYTLRILRAAS